MKKIYRILVLISFLFLIGFIVFFVLKITPKIKTKIYKSGVDYYVVLNTNKLDKKRSIIEINNNDYNAMLSIIYQKDNVYIYFLSFDDLKNEIQHNIDIYLYLQNISLFKYLTNKL